VTGPNIASQELLFNQIAETLRAETRGLVVVLRSGDASNLKTLLKKVIREATNQKDDDDDEHPAASRHDVSIGQMTTGYLADMLGSETPQL
jgi:origin recognition complex subunit 3